MWETLVTVIRFPCLYNSHWNCGGKTVYSCACFLCYSVPVFVCCRSVSLVVCVIVSASVSVGGAMGSVPHEKKPYSTMKVAYGTGYSHLQSPHAVLCSRDGTSGRANIRIRRPRPFASSRYHHTIKDRRCLVSNQSS